MHQSKQSYVPWRERAFVSPVEAAEIVGRTPGWVRERTFEGRLEAVQLTAGGPMAITVASLRRLIEGAKPARPAARRHRTTISGRPTLELVVDNSS